MGYHDSVTSRKSLFLFYNPSISFSLSGQLVDVIERQGHLLTVRQAGQPGVYELENGDHFQSSPLQWQVHRRSRKVEAHQSDRATAILRNKLPIVSGIHKKKGKKKKKKEGTSSYFLYSEIFSATIVNEETHCQIRCAISRFRFS